MTCFSFTYASLVGLSRLPYFTVIKLCYINTVHVQDPIYWIHVCYKPSNSLDIIRNMRQVCAFGPRDGRRVTSKKYISAEEDEKCAGQLGVEEFRSRQYPEKRHIVWLLVENKVRLCHSWLILLCIIHFFCCFCSKRWSPGFSRLLDQWLWWSVSCRHISASFYFMG